MNLKVKVSPVNCRVPTKIIPEHQLVEIARQNLLEINFRPMLTLLLNIRNGRLLGSCQTE